MPLNTHIDVGHRPDLDADALLTVLREGFGERFDVYEPGRFQVPDVIVKRSDSEGAAVQVIQQRLRKRTRLRIYPLAPSIARRASNPVTFAAQHKQLQPLAEEVVDLLRRRLGADPADPDH